MGKSRKKYYAVRVGRNTGIFHSWEECEQQVRQFPGARFKGFLTESEASSFMQEGPVSNGCIKPPSGPTQCGGDRASNQVATSNFSNDYLGGQHKQKSTSKQKAREKYSGNFMARHYSSPSSVSTAAPVPFTESVPSASAVSCTVSCTAPVPVVYCDGCCFRNGSSIARAGVGVFWSPGSPHNVSEVVTGKRTNIRAELTAATRAIQTAIDQGFSAIEIRTDSAYTIQVATNWHKKWLKNNWMTSEGTPVQNKEDIVKLLELGKRVLVKWTHVRGHSGIPGNEAADALAKAGANK